MDDEDSNMTQLPEEVKDYTYYHNQKRFLQRDLREVNRKLKLLDAKIFNIMREEKLNGFEIIPSEQQQHDFGSIGVLKVHTTTKYERLSKDNLIQLLHRFFQEANPEWSSYNCLQIGYGVASWIWKNRNKTHVHTLKREYKDNFDAQETLKRKKFMQDNNLLQGSNDRKRRKLPDNFDFPKTMEDFNGHLNIPAKLLQNND